MARFSILQLFMATTLVAVCLLLARWRHPEWVMLGFGVLTFGYNGWVAFAEPRQAVYYHWAYYLLVGYVLLSAMACVSLRS